MLAGDREASDTLASEDDFRIGEWTIRPQRDCIEGPGGVVRLAPKAMAVLVCLARAGGSVVSRGELFSTVWPKCAVTDDALTQRIVELRRAFGDSARQPLFIETIPKIGFRLMQPAVPLTGSGTPEQAGNGGKYSRFLTVRRPALGWTLIVLLAVSAGFFFLAGPGTDHSAQRVSDETGDLQSRDGPGPASTGGRSVAVLPFATSGLDEDHLYLVDAVHEEIVLRLTGISSIKVIAHASTKRYRDSGRSLREIGRELQVATILTGSVRRIGGQFRIRAQLVDAESGEYLWAEGFDREFSQESFFSTQLEIANQIAAALDASLSTSDSARIAVAPTENFQAYRDLLEGRAALEQGTIEGFEHALAHYEHALKLNSQLPQAHIAIAGAYSTAIEDRGVSQAMANRKIEEHALKALSIDPNLGHAYKFLAQVRRERGDYEGAEVLYRKALDLDPGNVNILHGLGLTLRMRGRAVESIPYYDRASELDPLSPVINESRASLLRDLGRFEEAEQQYRLTLELNPDFLFAYWGLGTLYWSRGDPVGAASWFEQAARVAPRSEIYRAWLALMHLELQRDQEARSVLDDLFREIPMSADNDAAMIEELYCIYHGLDLSALPDGRRILPAAMFGGLTQLPVRELFEERYAAALERYEEQYPGLSSGEILVDGSNYRAATYVALALDRVGERAQALSLLERVEMVMGGMRRLGIHGYWITDAQIHVIKGDPSRSLELLDAAVQEGWRNLWRFYFFHDPILRELRGSSEFMALARFVEQDMKAAAGKPMAYRSAAAGGRH